MRRAMVYIAIMEINLIYLYRSRLVFFHIGMGDFCNFRAPWLSKFAAHNSLLSG